MSKTKITRSIYSSQSIALEHFIVLIVFSLFLYLVFYSWFDSFITICNRVYEAES